MNLPEPSPTSFDLRMHLCGVPLRIHPLFWFSVAILGVRYYADPEAGGIGYFVFWILAVLASVLLHALGQAFVGCLFGMRGGIVLYGLGSLILGVDSLPRCWQRVVVFLAGPFVSFLVVGCIWGLTGLSFPATLSDLGRQTPIATGMFILVRINLTWGLLNVLPLWPLAGGRIAFTVGESLLSRKGQIAAAGLSLGATALLSVWVVLEMSGHLELHYDPRYLLHLEEFSILLLFCFLLWLRSFRILWPENTSDKETATY
jgi:stage IV sporulation protein FB